MTIAGALGYTLRMLMVIFGAGASFDSVPSKPPSEHDFRPPHELGGGDKYSCRPPLANQLFEERTLFAETLERYPQCLSIVPRLRHLGNRQLEDVLEQFQTEAVSYPPGFRQLAAVRYYLHHMLWECGKKWLDEAHGVTNYRTLLDEVNRFRKPDESVGLVTFNYDMLLEPGLEDLGFKIRQVSDYVEQDSYYKIFKVHGSVNWGRVVGIAGLEKFRHDVAPQPAIARMIELAEGLQITNSYALAPGFPMAWLEGQPIFPAIAIPVQTKSNFECPSGHLDQLKTLLPLMNKILIIGWRASEQHFLELLVNHLPRRVLVHIVAGSKVSAQSTGEVLQQALSTRQIDLSLDDGGFTDFMIEHRAKKFLGTQYD